MHGSAAKIANQIQRRKRRPILRSKRSENASYAQVIDVMTGAMRQRTLVAPPATSSKNEARICSQAFFRTQAETFHNEWSESFYDDIGFLQDSPNHGDALWLFKVHGNRGLTASHKIKLDVH